MIDHTTFAMPDGSLFALMSDISITCGDAHAPNPASAPSTASFVALSVAFGVIKSGSGSFGVFRGLNRPLRVLCRRLLLLLLLLFLSLPPPPSPVGPPLLRNMSRTLETPKE